MPAIDKPLAELLQYNGRNPRPADFDAYWAEALAELDVVDPAPELMPVAAVSTRAVECFDLWFTGVRGARIYAKYVRPRRDGRNPAVLQFHGYAGNSGEWIDKFGWAAEGFCVAALDCRGQGGRSEDNVPVRGTTLRGHIVRGLDDADPHRLGYRQIFLDTVQLARAVTQLPEVDAGHLGCMGGSQGGALALACAALEPRICRVAATHPFLCDYRRVWEMDLAKDAYDELRYFFRMFDPHHEREDEIFTKLGYIDCQHLAARIRAEVLMVTGLMDTVCPPSTQFAAYNKITAKKDLLIYPDYGHEYMPGAADRIFAFLAALRD